MEFVRGVEAHLQTMDYQMAALEIMNPDNLPYIHEEGMDLISKLCDIGLESAVEFDDISTCSELLNYICNHYNPKLALVSTLEQAETFMFSPKFAIILKAIQIVFERHPSKRAATYSWTLDLLNKHLREFHTFPEGLKNKLTEGQESLLVENDGKVRTIFGYYHDLNDFYIPIVKDFVSKCRSQSAQATGKEELGKHERILKSSLVNMLGAPLLYFDLTSPEDESKIESTPRKSRSRLQVKKPQSSVTPKQKSEARLIAERIMNQITQINLDSAFFLKWTEQKCLPQPVLTELDEIEYDEEVQEVEFQMTAIANYFYLIYVENLGGDHMQTSYTATHLLHVLLPLVNSLLIEEKQNYLTIEKGLRLAKKLIDQVTEPLNTEYLTGQVYSAFVDKLAQLIVYFDVKSTREAALAVLKTYFWKFDPAGRYMFFQFILIKIRHPGLVGYMIGQMKDCIALTLQREAENLEEMEVQFLGSNLSKLLVQICLLKDGAMTDLLEVNDQIMASLNLIRFLLLRDGATNKSGILNEMTKVDMLMLKPLRTALDLSKAHYVQRLKEMDDPDYKDGDQEAVAELTKAVSIEGVDIGLDDVSRQDRVKVLRHGLCNLDIMESLLARVIECYEAVTVTVN